MQFCPGLTARPLWNFSAALTGPSTDCPLLTQAAAPMPPAAAGAAAGFSIASRIFGAAIPTTAAECLLAWLVVFSTLFLCATLTTCCQQSAGVVLNRGLLYLPSTVLRTLDIYSLSHTVKDKAPLIKESTTLGGLFSLMGFSTLVAYSAYMVATWLQDNTLVQQSLATMEGSVWTNVAGVPWVAARMAPLVLRLSVDGDPQACSAPLSFTSSGLPSGALTLQSQGACGDTGVAQHTLLCEGCQLTGKTTATLRFHYSCQSFLLEALGTRPFPPPATLSSQVAPPGLTAASPSGAAFLSSLTWSLSLVLNVLNDTTASTGAIGWHIASQQLTADDAPSAAPTPLNGSLSLIPTASAVSLTLTLALASTYESTTLSERVPITQLLANIVGLGGMLSMFGILFAYFEQHCSRRSPQKQQVVAAASRAEDAALERAFPPAALMVDNPLHSTKEPGGARARPRFQLSSIVSADALARG